MNGTITIVASMGGITIQGVIARTAPATVPSQDVNLPKADKGTLTTRTNDTDGELTMDSASHGISTGDKIDIYWDGGMGYSATAGSVSGTSVPFTGMVGTLPAASTVCNADVQVALDADFDGDKLKALVAMMTRRGHVLFEDSGNAVLDEEELLPSEPYPYWDGSALTNPLTGNPVDEIRVTNGDEVNDGTFRLCGLYDSTS